jgi:N-acetylglucosaminyl-diphospho-decaprenol L-rhamnosyltransferase
MRTESSVIGAQAGLNSTAVPDMSVVLVCMNNKHYLEPCLASWYDAGFRFRFDLVVVDNGSTDGTQGMLRDKFPDVRIIENGRNVGLSRACNQGIEASQGRYVLLLNDDTLVDAASIESMLGWLDQRPRAGAVGGRLLTPDGSFQSGYADFSTLREEFMIATGLGALLWEGYPSRPGQDQPREVDWLCSACLLLRREALQDVGLLDEEYFIYGDEVDLQYRLKKAGWQVYYLPSAHTVHFGGRSLDRWRRRKMVYRGKMLFYRKNYGVLRTSTLRLMLALLSVAKLLFWGVAAAVPSRRIRAQRELHSNLDVVKLCRRLG